MTKAMPTGRRPIARIDGREIAVEPRETLLAAALRSGIDFPSGCRVGACGSCKCRLTAGDVKQLTETGYLLTRDELDDGYILACQSVPRSDVEIEVALAPTRARRRVAGRVVEQERVTPDITHLTVQLDEPLAYEAGQFAHVSIDGLGQVVRSYSFATPARADGQVSFYIRRAPGGRFSSLVYDEDVRGRGVRVEGPSGDFWLRPGDAPLLLVAGGSGLAPILAMLEQAAAAGATRPATLLFGARTAQDLYALDAIAAIASRWRGRFRFVPVLSAAADDASWSGERGLVTDKIAELLEPDGHVYLCGPPAMIDAAIARLGAEGVARERIRFDRFTTQADVAAAPDAAVSPRQTTASALHYLKFSLFHLIGLIALAAIIGGGRIVTGGVIGVLALYMIGDALGGDDTSTPRFRHPRILTAQLWLALPLLSLIVFAAVWSACPGDPLGFGAGITRLTGYDVLAARDSAGPGGYLARVGLTGIMIGMVGTIAAHELTHRTWDPVSMLIGRWLLAFSFDTSFAIEHVYGHHRYVATVSDPATAPRGRNVYAHIVASTFKGNISAFRIEAERLAKKRLPLFSIHNAFVRGHAMSLLLLVAACAMGGLAAASFFLASALWGKALLEIVNYMEHYGMVRDPATPVQPRHSWNTNRRLSSWTMFNLTRHSHHHAAGEVPYHDLAPYPEAPMMIHGYLTTILIAMIPPLWHALMTPKVRAWDRNYATTEERALAARANAASGLRELQRAG